MVFVSSQCYLFVDILLGLVRSGYQLSVTLSTGDQPSVISESPSHCRGLSVSCSSDNTPTGDIQTHSPVGSLQGGHPCQLSTPLLPDTGRCTNTHLDDYPPSLCPDTTTHTRSPDTTTHTGSPDTTSDTGSPGISDTRSLCNTAIPESEPLLGKSYQEVSVITTPKYDQERLNLAWHLTEDIQSKPFNMSRAFPTVETSIEGIKKG